MPIKDAVASIINPIAAALKKAGDERKKIETKLEGLKVKRENLLSAPTSKIDLVNGIEKWIDSEAATYRQRITDRLETFSARPMDATTVGTTQHPFELGLFQLDYRGTVEGRAGVQPGALCLFLGDQLKKLLAAEVEAAIKDSGPPAVDRDREVADLDSKIEDAEAELLALKQVAKDGGFRLD